MPEIPTIFGRDPDRWRDEIVDITRKLREQLEQTLATTETIGELADRLDELVGGLPVRIGNPLDDTTASVTRTDDEVTVHLECDVPIERTETGHWTTPDAFFGAEEPMPREMHEEIAERICTFVDWGLDIRDEVVLEAKRARGLFASYLERVERNLEGEYVRAEDFRPALVELLRRHRGWDDIRIEDWSSGPDRTHLRLHYEPAETARNTDAAWTGDVYGFEPGSSLDLHDLDHLLQIYENPDAVYSNPGAETDVVFVTDHVRFVDLTSLDTGQSAEPTELILPSEKSEDLERFHRGIQTVSRTIRRAASEYELQ